MIKSSELWLEPLYKRMHELLHKRDVLRVKQPCRCCAKKTKRPSKSYMWLYRTGREEPAIVPYDYHTTRASKHSLRFLSRFKSYLHVDGYAFYNGLPSITQRNRERLKRSRPIIDEFKAWLDYQRLQVLPKSAFGQAIA